MPSRLGLVAFCSLLVLDCQAPVGSRPIARASDVAFCARGSSGVECATWGGLGFGEVTPWTGVLADVDGWGSSPAYWGTLRRPDLDGDVASDLCARGVRGLICARREQQRFGEAVESGPEFADAAGFAEPQYALSLQFPDLDGDRHADACARGPLGLVCARGRGDGRFDPGVLLTGGVLDTPDAREVLLFGDLDGDGRDDMCLRHARGVDCALSLNGRLSAPSPWTSGFSGARGFDQPINRTTIALTDVNGDGRADLCGRGPAGLECALSTGRSFADPVVWSAAFSDANGGGDEPGAVGSLRFADVDGDGRDDACARSGETIVCALSAGDHFAAPTAWSQGVFLDAERFDRASAWASFTYVDLNRDGRNDVCARGTHGAVCAYSTGTGFDRAMSSPAFSDDTGWVARPDAQLVGAGPLTQLRYLPNRVSLENERPGTPGWWVPYPQWSLRHEMEGYADALSYPAGATVVVRASTAADGDPIQWTLLRTGYYGGAGARAIAGGVLDGRRQPLPAHATWAEPARANWQESFRVPLPADAVSGVYALRLTNLNQHKTSFITFVVREDGRRADLAVGRADYTDQMYNNWDGQDLTSSAYINAQWVSIDRPLRSAYSLGFGPYSSGYFVYEYSMIRWLERQGYDLTYLSNWDVDHDRHALDRAGAYLSIGHDEYWTATMRDNVEAARDAGKHLGFFGADMVDGVLRFNLDGRSFTARDQNRHRAIWQDKPIRPGAAPHDQSSEELTGSRYAGWCGDIKRACSGLHGDGQPFGRFTAADDYVFEALRHPLLRNVRLGPFNTMAKVVGYEYEVPYAGQAPLPFQIQVLARASALTVRGGPPAMVAYQTAAGAKVFNAGSMHWTHALDGWAGRAVFRLSDGERGCGAKDKDCFAHENPAAQQLTANVLADFGARPATPWPKLTGGGACDWLQGCK